MKKYSSILLLSFGLLSGVAMAGGTTEAGIGGALGGVLGSVVGNSIGGSTGGAIGAGLGGAAGGALGADKRQRGEAAIGGALGAAGGNVVGRSVGVPPVATLVRRPAAALVGHWATTWATRPMKTSAMSRAATAVTMMIAATMTVATTTVTANTSATGATDRQAYA